MAHYKCLLLLLLLLLLNFYNSTVHMGCLLAGSGVPRCRSWFAGCSPVLSDHGHTPDTETGLCAHGPGTGHRYLPGCFYYSSCEYWPLF